MRSLRSQEQALIFRRLTVLSAVVAFVVGIRAIHSASGEWVFAILLMPAIAWLHGRVLNFECPRCAQAFASTSDVTRNFFTVLPRAYLGRSCGRCGWSLEEAIVSDASSSSSVNPHGRPSPSIERSAASDSDDETKTDGDGANDESPTENK